MTSGAETPPPAAAPPIVQLDSVTAVRAGGEIAVRDLSWTIRHGETWAIVGPVASGKTALAETLMGRHHIRSGEIRWPLIEQVRASVRLRVRKARRLGEDGDAHGVGVQRRHAGEVGIDNSWLPVPPHLDLGALRRVVVDEVQPGEDVADVIR